MQKSDSIEVDIDAKLNSHLNEHDFVWMDDVISRTVSTLVVNCDMTSAKMSGLRTLVASQEFQVQLEKGVSIVDSFTYLFTNIEQVVGGCEFLNEEAKGAVITCCKDLAASFHRIQHSDPVDKEVLEDKVKKLSEQLNWSEAHQFQCDLTYLAAINSDQEQFRKSLQKEINLLFRLNNTKSALEKILHWQLFRTGLEVISEYLKEAKLDEFEDIFSSQKKVFDKFLDYMDETGGDTEEVNRDRAAAKIIVDQNGPRGFIDGKFRVQDLQSALKLAQNGGTVFLENGDYTTDTFFNVCQFSKDPNRLVQIIGASNNECSIHGTLRLQAESQVIFRRIKFEVGDSADSTDAIHVSKGMVVFEECLLEACVNTLFYVAGNTHAETGLRLKFCIVDGLESCQRAATFSGPNVNISLEQSMFSDMFSVVTNYSTETLSGLLLSIVGCCFSDVQDGVRLVFPGASDLGAGGEEGSRITLVSSQASLVLYSDEDLGTQSGLEVVGGVEGGCLEITVTNNMFFFSHTDGRGVVVTGARKVAISRTKVATTDQVDRKLAVGEGIVQRSVNILHVDHLQVDGFRAGLRLEGVLSGLVRNFCVSNCSIGVVVGKQSQTSSRCRVELGSCTFRTMYYGIMGEDTHTCLCLQDTKFVDIPKALLLCQAMVGSLVEETCQYLMSREYTSREGEWELLEAEMNLWLATQENLPHRVAYQREEVLLINKFHHLSLNNL